MDHAALIEKFYTAFAAGDAREMTDCYHENIVFQDPAFGKLTGERAGKMWEMLLSRRTDSTKISFRNVQADENSGSAEWTAEYLFGPQKRPVVNQVSAKFKFKDGKIIEHLDHFDFWKWSQQALGASGYLLGWTPFLRNKVQQTTNQQLDAYVEEQS